MVHRGQTGWLLLVLVLALAGCDKKIPLVAGSGDNTVTAGEATAAHSLLALGDSFSSGEGAPVPGKDDGFLAGTDTDGNTCHRSSEAYGYELKRQLGDAWSLTFRACSGAKLENLGVELSSLMVNKKQKGEPFQTDLGDRKYDVVTMTMGGNDLNFAGILADCVEHGWVNHIVRFAAGRLLQNRVNKNLCQGKHEKAVNATLPALEPKFVKAYQALKKLTKPGGQVIILGYPLFFPDNPPGSCSSGAADSFGASDMLWLNNVARRADAVIERAALKASVSYIDEHNLFRTGGIDHGLCQGDTRGDTARWVNRFISGAGRNGLLPDKAWSFHPTVAAHKAEAQHLLACVRDRSTCDPARQPFPSLEQVLPFPDKFDYPQIGDFGEDPRQLHTDLANGTTAIATRPEGCLLLQRFVVDPATGTSQRAAAIYPFIVDHSGGRAQDAGTIEVSLYKVVEGQGENLRTEITGWPEKCVLRYTGGTSPPRTMRTTDFPLEPSGETYQGVSLRYDFPYSSYAGYFSVGYSNGYVLEMTWRWRTADLDQKNPRLLKAVNDTASVIRHEIDEYLPTTFDQRG